MPAVLTLVLLASPTGCRPLRPTRTADEHRATARALAQAGDRGEAHREYVRAMTAGDEMARLEDGLLRAGALPELAERVAAEPRYLRLAELADIDADAATGRGLYGGAAACAIAGTVSGLVGIGLAFATLCWGCDTMPSFTPAHIAWTVAGALGGVSLLLLGTAIGFDVDTGARRGRWRERIEALEVELSVAPDHAGLALSGRFGD